MTEERKLKFSMYELFNTNPVRLVDGVLSSRPLPNPDGPRINVVLVMDDVGAHMESLASVASITYPHHCVTMLCPDERIYETYAGLFKLYKQELNFGGVFKPANPLSGDEVIVNALAVSPEPYTCFVFAGDTLHPGALTSAATAINRTAKSYYYSDPYCFGTTGWAAPHEEPRPDNRLALFSTAAALKIAERLPPCECQYEFLWLLARAMAPVSELIPESLYFKADTPVESLLVARYKGFVKEVAAWAARKS